MAPVNSPPLLDASSLQSHQLPVAFSSLTSEPGLTLICGEDERVARALFAALKSSSDANASVAEHQEPSVYWHDAIPREANDITGTAWLHTQQHGYRSWDADLAADLIEAFSLELHIDKPLYMYSLGSARKLNLVAAFASGVRVTCLESPFAALDGASCALVAEFLSEASEHPERSWLLFDFERPEWLRQARFSQLITF